MANILCLLFHLWDESEKDKRHCTRKDCTTKHKLKNGRWVIDTSLNKPVKKFVSKAHLLKDKEI